MPYNTKCDQLKSDACIFVSVLDRGNLCERHFQRSNT